MVTNLNSNKDRKHIIKQIKKIENCYVKFPRISDKIGVESCYSTNNLLNLGLFRSNFSWIQETVRK